MGMVKEWRENREKLERGEVQLEVVELRNELITVNNRRLFAAKILKAMVGGEIWIPIKIQKFSFRLVAKCALLLFS